MDDPADLDLTGALEHLRARLADERPAKRSAEEGLSGVLIPLRVRDGEQELILTRRTDHLSSHPGEVSFPGGRVEAGDEDPRDAALRETEEEVGLPTDHVELAGLLTTYQPFRGPLIHAYVGVLDPQAPEPHRASPGEVAEVLTVPVTSFLEPGRPLEGRPWAVQGYEARAWWDEDRGDRVVHYWHLDEETRVWGITGELMARFLAHVYDWLPPRRPRRVADVQGFLD